MKVLVFAHVPPPHHGQSYMVQLMLSGFGGDQRRGSPKSKAQSPKPEERAADESAPNSKFETRNSKFESPPIECYHVNARISKKLEDIGDLRFAKVILLVSYCLQAIWCHFRYGVDNFYYIPAPGKRSALYRDWLVMFLCRPFFKRLILHWHAAGLGKWLETAVQIRSRAVTYRTMKEADLCVVLSNYNRGDAEKLLPRRIQVVSNGIPDPCPDFESEVSPRRRARRTLRARLMAGEKAGNDELKLTGPDPQVIKVLYLAHCMREKGLFDTINGVLLANQHLAEDRSPVFFRLLVAGNFVSFEEKREFEQLMARPESAQSIQYFGFVAGEQKNRLLREADLFCFPTFYQNENQPVNLIEAMAFGLPIVTTRWRSLPEMFPPDYPGLVDTRSPGQIAQALLQFVSGETSQSFRQIFERNFTLESYLSGLARAFQSIEQPAPDGPAAGFERSATAP